MKTWGVLAAISVVQFGCHTAATTDDGQPMPVLLFSDGLVDPATGESSATLSPDLEKLTDIAAVYPSKGGGTDWHVDPTGRGLLITTTGWRRQEQSEGFYYWKSWKQSDPLQVYPATSARFKSDGWIYYTICAANGLSFERRLMSTDNPDVKITVPDTKRDLLDVNRDGIVIWVANEKLVVSQVRDGALHELHRWDVPMPPWAKGASIWNCKLDSSGTWAALGFGSKDVCGLMVINVSDGKVAWVQGDWCKVLWAGNAKFRCESDSRHIALLSLEGTLHLSEERGLPNSVTSVGEVSPDGRWAICRKRAPWFAPAISDGDVVLDMQTMRTYKGLSGLDRRVWPVGWLSGDVGAEEGAAK